MSIELEIAAAVTAALDAHLKPFARRLADPECLTYTVPQAAAVVGCSARKVEQWVAEGVLPRVPHLAHIRIPRVAVEAFVLGADASAAVHAALDESIAQHKLRAVS